LIGISIEGVGDILILLWWCKSSSKESKLLTKS